MHTNTPLMSTSKQAGGKVCYRYQCSKIRSRWPFKWRGLQLDVSPITGKVFYLFKCNTIELKKKYMLPVCFGLVSIIDCLRGYRYGDNVIVQWDCCLNCGYWNISQHHKSFIVFTSQVAVITKALKVVMLETNHRLCALHIRQNYNNSFNEGGVLFKNFKKYIVNYEDEREFGVAWNTGYQNLN